MSNFVQISIQCNFRYVFFIVHMMGLPIFSYSIFHPRYGSTNNQLYPSFWMCCLLNLVYTSVPLTRCAIRMHCVFGARLINFPQTWGEQKTRDEWKGHLVHPVLFVFMQKTDKFRFVVNGMRTIRGQCSTGSQSHPHIRAFDSQTVREWFVNRLARSYIRGISEGN